MSTEGIYSTTAPAVDTTVVFRPPDATARFHTIRGDSTMVGPGSPRLKLLSFRDAELYEIVPNNLCLEQAFVYEAGLALVILTTSPSMTASWSFPWAAASPASCCG